MQIYKVLKKQQSLRAVCVVST